MERLARDEAEQKRLGLENLSRGWAIGTEGWRRAVAKSHQHLALNPGLEAQELREIRQACWEQALAEGLDGAGKTGGDVERDIAGTPWKIALAVGLRRAGAPHAWIASRLHMGRASSVRAYVSQAKDSI